MTGRETIGTVDYDLLLANGVHDPDVEGVALKESAQLAKGTVLLKDSNGDVYPLGTEDSGTTITGEAFAIVAKDMEAEGTNVVAYRTGDFVKQALITVEDYEITQADIDSLKKYGIYLDGAMV